jgi:hypothetical protein
METKPLADERFLYFDHGSGWTIIRLGRNKEGHDISWPFPNTTKHVITAPNEHVAERTARNLAFLTDSKYEKGSR